MFWDDERVENLRRLHAEGLSASVIAERLGAQSRSAVIGKLHRIGAPKRPSTLRKKAHVQRPQRQRTKRERVTIPPTKARVWSPVPVDGTPLPEPQPQDIARVSLLKLDPARHCRWVCAEMTSIDAPVYCGCKPVPGLSWCEHHARRVFQQPSDTKRSGYSRQPQRRMAIQTAIVADLRTLEEAT